MERQTDGGTPRTWSLNLLSTPRRRKIVELTGALGRRFRGPDGAGPRGPAGEIYFLDVVVEAIDFLEKGVDSTINRKDFDRMTERYGLVVVLRPPAEGRPARSGPAGAPPEGFYVT